MINSSVAGQPLIIEASLNGSTPKARNPSAPYSDEEIVEQAVACMEAGAALIHNHTAEPIIGGSGVMDAERYASAWRKLLAVRPDATLTPTMAVGQEGVAVETRYAHVVKLAEEGIIAQGLCDPGSFNLGMLDQEGLFGPSTYLYKNDMHDSRYYVETCRRLNIGLSIWYSSQVSCASSWPMCAPGKCRPAGCSNSNLPSPNYLLGCCPRPEDWRPIWN